MSELVFDFLKFCDRFDDCFIETDQIFYNYKSELVNQSSVVKSTFPTAKKESTMCSSVSKRSVPLRFAESDNSDKNEYMSVSVANDDKRVRKSTSVRSINHSSVLRVHKDDNTLVVKGKQNFTEKFPNLMKRVVRLKKKIRQKQNESFNI